MDSVLAGRVGASQDAPVLRPVRQPHTVCHPLGGGVAGFKPVT